ncbi:MAG TPA: MauE/DoxX family redox-associated membrane protein [Acidimicrobiales bacterium]|jgi:uncharacterized membrane protein YphA (DoxX/SURF4 family)
MAYFSLGARCLLGAVFLVSAFSKLRSRRALDEFTASVRRLGRVPRRLARPVAVVVAAAEALVPVLLVAPGPSGVGLALATGLLGLFLVAIIGAMRRGSAESCRCFGTSDTPLGLRHAIRNVVLMMIAALGIAGSSQPVPTGDAFVVAAGALLAAVLVVMLDDLMDLLAPIPR